MDEFAQSLERDHLPEWSDQYLDYQSLQDKVDTVAASIYDEATSQHHKSQVESELTSATVRIASSADCDNSSWYLQPLLTRISEKFYHFTDSKSQLCNETCKTSKAHTEACMILCQTTKQVTPASATHVKSTCNNCNNSGNMYQTCYR